MAAPQVGTLDHEGAWTEQAYLALPPDPRARRVELVDGSLLVAPSTDERHARAVAAVRAAVRAALPDGLEVVGPVALRLAPGRILVPDLVVAARESPCDDPPADPVPDDPVPDDPAPDGAVRDCAAALLVVDVVGRGNGVAERWFKPQLYAVSRIPYAVLVDHDDPFAVANMLISGRYHEYAQAEGDGVLRLEEPFGLELELSAVTGAEPGAAEEEPVGTGP